MSTKRYTRFDLMGNGNDYQTYIKDCDCKSNGIILHNGVAVCRWCRKPYAEGGLMNYLPEHFPSHQSIKEEQPIAEQEGEDSFLKYLIEQKEKSCKEHRFERASEWRIVERLYRNHLAAKSLEKPSGAYVSLNKIVEDFLASERKEHPEERLRWSDRKKIQEREMERVEFFDGAGLDKKRDWEIIEIRNSANDSIIKIVDGRTVGDYYVGFEVEKFLKELTVFKIHSVKRLSDNATFSVGDEVFAKVTSTSRLAWTIKGFNINYDDRMRVGVSGGGFLWLNQLSKNPAQPQPTKDRDWEIVRWAYKGGYFTDAMSAHGFDTTIDSVKRISTGEIFRVGDVIEYCPADENFTKQFYTGEIKSMKVVNANYYRKDNIQEIEFEILDDNKELLVHKFIRNIRHPKVPAQPQPTKERTEVTFLSEYFGDKPYVNVFWSTKKISPNEFEPVTKAIESALNDEGKTVSTSGDWIIDTIDGIAYLNGQKLYTQEQADEIARHAFDAARIEAHDNKYAYKYSTYQDYKKSKA